MPTLLTQTNRCNGRIPYRQQAHSKAVPNVVLPRCPSCGMEMPGLDRDNCDACRPEMEKRSAEQVQSGVPQGENGLDRRTRPLLY